MNRDYNKKIILEDGAEFYGYGFGADQEMTAEIVFNTSMVGYQEILSDPSYTGQAVVMTYPLIGNYGICAEDFETDKPSISAMIVREYNDDPSNFRAVQTLQGIMRKYGIVGLAGVDTRALARHIRDKGTGKALICDATVPNIVGVARLKINALRRDQVEQVSTKTPWRSSAENARFHVVAVDCGIKHNIIRSLNRRDCDVTIVPWNISAAEVEAMHPDGLFLSNGPGNPEDAKPVIQLVRTLKGKLPVFGICLGHQILALSYGARTYKLKFGHRGGNHPVKNLLTGKVEITSQNHSYAVDAQSLDGTGLEVTHINLLDNTVEGLRCAADRVFSVQYHPESAPGPQDSEYLFDEFIRMMEESRNA
ncbi:MAG: glutamine-hydrolyzing carbamoyl-phosphate synthase small subunit [Oscillospiraceae bacterium]|nr:glutamine-hydrolyzing carbamoyl-phosphate synthase small subunit [Oscillospiraceae bacterium]